MRAACYCRVSSAAQRERDTIASQLKELPAYVRAMGWTLVETYVDDGKSAKAGQLDKRDAWSRLVADAESRLFDVVVVVDINRITRTDNFLERAQILDPLQRNKIQIATPSSGLLDLGTMLGELGVMLKAWASAEDSRVRVEASIRGKRHSAELGRKVTGITPYGLRYSRESHEWSIDPVAGPIVADLAARAIAGATCYELSVDMQRRGIRGLRNGSWGCSRVWALLTSRHICGEYIADKARRVVVRVPPIISEDEWGRVQSAMEQRRHKSRDRTKRVYVAQGLAVCECGSPIRIDSARVNFNGRKSYQRAGRYLCAAGCRAWTIADIDERVWNAVRVTLEDPALVSMIAAAGAEPDEDAAAWERDAKEYAARLERLGAKESAVLERFRRDVLSEAALDRELTAIRKERGLLRSQLATAERASKSQATKKTRLTAATDFVGAIRQRLADASPDERKAIVAAFVDPGGIELGEGVRVAMWLPTADSGCGNSHSDNVGDPGAKFRLGIRVVG